MLFYLNWQMTTITLVVLLSFGGVMTIAFKRLRPIFRQRNAITAEVTGRLAQAMGGVRIVKTYVAERREQKTFAVGIHKLFRNIASTLTGISLVTAFSTLIIGIVGIIMFIFGGRAVLDGRMTLGDLLMYAVFVGTARGAAGADRRDRDADQRGVRRARSHSRDPPHGDGGCE